MFQSLNRVYQRLDEIRQRFREITARYNQVSPEHKGKDFKTVLNESMNKLSADKVELSSPRQNISLPYENLINRASQKYQVPGELIKAVIKEESNFNPSAVSVKGAQGLMQLMPDTARQMNIQNALNPEQNIDGGTRYLKNMISRYDGNLIRALAAYNAGPGTVSHNELPNYTETRNYISKVIDSYKKFSGAE